MSRPLALLTIALLAGCQAAGGAAGVVRPARAGGDEVTRLAEALAGDFDNHEQATHAAAAAPVRRIQQSLRIVERTADGLAFSWRLQPADAPGAAVWLMRAVREADGRMRITPYRALEAAAAQALAADPRKDLRSAATQWADLAPCALVGGWRDAHFVAAANIEACSALLPGLGADAALLPLRMTLEADVLELQTFADRARGSEAVEVSRRVRWFTGWSAINGGGPRATAQNQDWHLQNDLRIGSEGGRASLRWRDGTPSGYSLELERTNYPERSLSALQLNVIEDATGKTVTYAWSDAGAKSIGMNLGWLQVGLVQEPPSAPGSR